MIRRATGPSWHGAFGRCERAATAVEFAMIAPVFVFLLLMGLQYGLAFTAGRLLQSAADGSSRALLTGQAQANRMSQSQFKGDVCSRLRMLFDCSKLFIDVKAYNSFAGAAYSTPAMTYDAGGNATNAASYDPGRDGDIVIVRIVYQWKVFGGAFAFGTAGPSGKSVLMMGTAAFRVEPYS